MKKKLQNEYFKAPEKGKIMRMKKIKSVFFVSALLSVFIPAVAPAVTEYGGQGGSYLSWGAGARSLAMGKAFVSIADDATACYWNPAGLHKLDRGDATALYAGLWYDTSYQYISGAYPTPKGGTFGISGVRLHTGGIDKRDIYNVSEGTTEDSQIAAGFSYGRMFLEKIALGSTFKYASHTLDGDTDMRCVLDAGAQYRLMDKLDTGAVIQNILQLRFGENRQPEWPVILRLGASYRLLNGRMLAALDLERIMKKRTGIIYHAGIEYELLEFIKIRLGVDNFEEGTLGLGFNYRGMRLDYAFAGHTLGNSHRVSASTYFGQSILERRTARAREFYSEGIGLYRQGRYTLALEKVSEALNLLPENEEMRSVYNNLKVISNATPSITEKGKIADLIRDGAVEFIEGEPKNAVKAIQYAASLDADNIYVRPLLESIGAATGLDISMEGIGKEWTLVDQGLHRALTYFKERKYALAVQECQDVLKLDPSNALAYKRMGSAFFALGKMDKALESWEKALILEKDPDEKEELRDLIRNLRR